MKNDKRRKSLIIILSATVIAVAVLIAILYLTDKEEMIEGKAESAGYTVMLDMPGRVVKIYVQEGDHVNEGDTLAIVETFAPDSNESCDDDGKTTYGDRKERLRVAATVLQQVKTGYAVARESYENIQSMYDEGLVSEKSRDEAYVNYRAYEAQLQAAQAQYEMLKSPNGTTKQASKKTQEAGNMMYDGSMSEGEMMLTAQTEGEIADVYSVEGETVVAGIPILSVMRTDDVWASFTLAESRMEGVAVGTKLEVYIPSFDKTVDMLVFYIKENVSHETHKAVNPDDIATDKTYEVKARPLIEIDGLRPGMTMIVNADR